MLVGKFYLMDLVFKYTERQMRISPIPPSPGESSISPNTINTPPNAGNKLRKMLFTIFIFRL